MRTPAETTIPPAQKPPGASLLEAPGGGHRYGGPWTEIKLDAVMYHAECYTKALTPVGFDLWCVDAFAGSGERQAERQRGGIFEGEPIHVIMETLAGSARRALTIEPPFHHFVFNEPNPVRNRELQRLKAEYPLRDIRVLNGDANEVLKSIFGAPPWTKLGKARAMVFLDPYAMQVDWETLELLAKTKAVDVWYLFPLLSVTRQLARRRSGIGPKEHRLDRVLSPRWRDLYSLPPPDETPRQIAMFDFDQAAEPEEERTASQKQVEGWFRQQLGTIFSYASEPLPLLTGATRQAFSLFLCVANPSVKATDLAKHFHRHVMKNFAPGASRRTSGRGGPGR